MKFSDIKSSDIGRKVIYEGKFRMNKVIRKVGVINHISHPNFILQLVYVDFEGEGVKPCSPYFLTFAKNHDQ